MGETDAPGLTCCPDCGQELETVALEGEKPMQCATRECPDCGTTVTIGLCWWPGDEGYSVTGTASSNETCQSSECPADADIVTATTSKPVPAYYCTDDAPRVRSRAYEYAKSREE